MVSQVSPATLDGPVALPYIRSWQATSKSLSDIGYYSLSFTSASAEQQKVHAIHIVSSPSLFDALQVKPAIGRVFHANDAAGPLAVLSDRLAKALFRGRTAIGRTVSIDDVVYTVTAVMPEGLYFPLANPGPVLWTRLVASPQWEDRRYAGLRVFARLAPGASLSGAQQELNARARSDKDWEKDNRLALTPYREYVTAGAARSLKYLQIAAILVWLLGCFNIAGLSVSYAIRQRQRMAIQKSLGSPFRTLVLECLVESSILSILGCLLGFFLASMSLGAFEQFLAQNLPFSPRLTLDLPVCVALLGAAAASAVLTSIVPALYAYRSNPVALLRLQGADSSRSRRATFIRQALLMIQLVLTIVLLTGTGLLFRSVYALHHVSLGFESRNVMSAAINLPAKSQMSLPAVYDPILSDVRLTSGVASAALSNVLPVDPGSNVRMPVVLPGTHPGAIPPVPALRIVSRDYYKTLRIAVLRGHTFSPLDTQFSAVVNRAFVRRYFSSVNPLSQTVTFPPVGFPGGSAMIIGVVEDTRQVRLSVAADPEVDISYEQFPVGSPLLRMLLPAGVHIAVRTTDSDGSVMRAVREVLSRDAKELLLSPAPRWRKPLRQLFRIR